ncbi:conserved hypothetical protein [Neospora caninum Liverpool]|uniref:CRAL-TRIO domain-containing protein n=1 Tax=Neospora caninum (strain Liverpool) TaxID=572307 RepID=F0VK06_NEOCL|nr:conserved hypothetical protein [Neospora caninum Liverpool]CBZ54051.1 conserved hypothetical protein [Neospora caninum Liverpool]CEL68747.1 TPA: hypothetical protein BN1204_044850 [Neospora caninum Liverpool]|eukprot:XP_003884082.1 conserved hypothetical protein [Neospora caninum Liverpool]
MTLPTQFPFLFFTATSLHESTRLLNGATAASAPLPRALMWRKRHASRRVVFGVAIALATVLLVSQEHPSVASSNLVPLITCAEADPKADAEPVKQGPAESNNERSRQTKRGNSRSSNKSQVGALWKRPPPMPESRVRRALGMFETVHSQMTLFFKGFSRSGSVIAYDLLDELRTVKEATHMMDVEFLVLDRVMDHYGSRSHLRVVDTKVMCKFLDLSNLWPWKIPGLLADIKKMVLEYRPVLAQFLGRYGELIEALILTSVPAGLHPFRSLIAALIGVPRKKLVFASSLQDLEKYIPREHIPREFWNPTGGPVREGWENKVSWRIMLEEVQLKLGADSVTPKGKQLLQSIKEEEAGYEKTADRGSGPAAQSAPPAEEAAGENEANEDFLGVAGTVNADVPVVSGNDMGDVSSAGTGQEPGDFTYPELAGLSEDDFAAFANEDFDDVD